MSAACRRSPMRSTTPSVPRQHPYPDAARLLAELEGGRGSGTAQVRSRLVPHPRAAGGRPCRGRLYRRPRTGDGAAPDGNAGAPAAARRRGRRRQDRSRQGAGRRCTEHELIRLQCYEGLDQNAALYEWNYQRQLLAIKIREGSGTASDQLEEAIFSEKYLLERPLLAAIRQARAAGAADRRDRPGGRGIRGLPAGTAVGFPDHHPGTRHDRGNDASRGWC